MRKVKIVCTLGPACGTPEMLRELAVSGMDVARFNFSHGDHESHGRMLDMIRDIERELDRPIATLLDTKGPEIRTGDLVGHAPVEIVQGSTFTLSTRQFDGDASSVSISYEDLPKEVEPGRDIFIDDGAIHLTVSSISGTEIECAVRTGGMLGEKKGINVPGADLSVPTLTEKDVSDIRWGIEHEMDYIAVSFVRSRKDIMEVRRVVENCGPNARTTRIMAKIETLQSVQNLEEIVQVVDAVMVARGDLGVEMPAELVPMVQKRVVDLCRANGKPVIVATQMLDSMIRSPRPTRAEASDVANAVLDGADAVMLSGETAGGKYPLEAVRMMENIVVSTERDALSRQRGEIPGIHGEDIPDAVSHSAMQVAEAIGAAAIVPLTHSGSTASMISKYRPRSAIIASTSLRPTWRAMTLMWGVRPILIPDQDTTEGRADASIDVLIQKGFASKGDTVVLTSGFPPSVSGTTNMLIVLTVGRTILRAPSLVKADAVGFICTASSAQEAIEKMRPGNVLVVKSADAHYLPAIRRASAIIVEEIGMAGFAAITALQLGIPCMTGVDGALEKLRDGMFVTVDGRTGAVSEGRNIVGRKKL